MNFLPKTHSMICLLVLMAVSRQFTCCRVDPPISRFSDCFVIPDFTIYIDLIYAISSFHIVLNNHRTSTCFLTTHSCGYILDCYICFHILYIRKHMVPFNFHCSLLDWSLLKYYVSIISDTYHLQFIF